jgi:SnoaL-like domain
MAAFDPRALFESFIRLANAGDWDALEQYVQPDYEEVYPQSGERIKGMANARAILEHYPGGALDRTADRLVGSEDRWVLTPAATVLRIEGTGDTYTAISKASYPDGSTWFVISVAELRDQKVAKVQTFFAPTFEPPAWRSQWVDTTPGS